jgi:hypothetical protein
LSAEHVILALEATPDPRLVEVVRFLARRAARHWFEQQMRSAKGTRNESGTLCEVQQRQPEGRV